VGAIGGAADIAAGARRLFVAMDHTTREGEFKIVNQCTYPLTAVGVVKKVFTDIAVLSLDSDGFVLEEVAPGWTPEDVQSQSEAPLRFSPDVHEIDLS